MSKKHQFHLVDPSPWPILVSFALLFCAIGFIFYIHDLRIGKYLLPISCISLFITLFLWWRDVIQEGQNGHHSEVVKAGLKIGIIIFFISETFLFASFFATYFFSKINPVVILDGIWDITIGKWPPAGITKINPWDLPFINTLILLLSSNSVTWAIYEIETKNQKDSSLALIITVMLGFLFLAFQIYEYHHAEFSMKDGIYGSNFYLTTGFHGLHVLIGAIFLLICYFRAKRGDFIKGSYLGVEFAAWYWHFVDLIWLFLFVFMYILD
ncbi:MAG: cytochrome c oxidase subunit 3 [Rickettsia sp.]|nr:cytochrome c oxidase subunit 3 [Rickettsia sp.]